MTRLLEKRELLVRGARVPDARTVTTPSRVVIGSSLESRVTKMKEGDELRLPFHLALTRIRLLQAFRSMHPCQFLFGVSSCIVTGKFTSVPYVPPLKNCPVGK